WRDDVLVKGVPLFASRTIQGEDVIHVGRAEDHVVFRVGSWSFYLRIQDEGRFPVVDDLVGKAASGDTRLRLDPEDVTFLRATLDRLPGRDQEHSPITLDLNGEVVVRAGDAAHPMELILARSATSGSPLHTAFNRSFLARAARLGMSELIA